MEGARFEERTGGEDPLGIGAPVPRLLLDPRVQHAGPFIKFLSEAFKDVRFF